MQIVHRTEEETRGSLWKPETLGRVLKDYKIPSYTFFEAYFLLIGRIRSYVDSKVYRKLCQQGREIQRELVGKEKEMVKKVKKEGERVLDSRKSADKEMKLLRLSNNVCKVLLLEETSFSWIKEYCNDKVFKIEKLQLKDDNVSNILQAITTCIQDENLNTDELNYILKIVGQAGQIGFLREILKKESLCNKKEFPSLLGQCFADAAIRGYTDIIDTVIQTPCYQHQEISSEHLGGALEGAVRGEQVAVVRKLLSDKIFNNKISKEKLKEVFNVARVIFSEQDSDTFKDSGIGEIINIILKSPSFNHVLKELSLFELINGGFRDGAGERVEEYIKTNFLPEDIDECFKQAAEKGWINLTGRILDSFSISEDVLREVFLNSTFNEGMFKMFLSKEMVIGRLDLFFQYAVENKLDCSLDVVKNDFCLERISIDNLEAFLLGVAFQWKDWQDRATGVQAIVESGRISEISGVVLQQAYDGAKGDCRSFIKGYSKGLVEGYREWSNNNRDREMPDNIKQHLTRMLEDHLRELFTWEVARLNGKNMENRIEAVGRMQAITFGYYVTAWIFAPFKWVFYKAWICKIVSWIESFRIYRLVGGVIRGIGRGVGFMLGVIKGLCFWRKS